MSVALMPIVGSRESEVLAVIERMVLDSIAGTGGDARLYQRPSDLEAASHLLVPGVGSWGNDRLIEALSEARKRGVQRVLWQMETLPPPDLPLSLTARFLFRKTPYRVASASRLLDNLALKRLSRECRVCSSWNSKEMDARRLGLPVREARHILALWRDGLLDRILVSLESQQQFLRTVGVESAFMPFGYHPFWGWHMEQERDLDVVFIGTPTPRRRPLLDRLAGELSEAGFRLTIVESGCYGEERTELLNRSKIFLQLRQYPWELPKLRFLMAMGCKTLFATEQFDDTKPFCPGEHFIMAPLESLAGTMIRYLRDEAARRDVVERLFDFARSELDMGRLLVGALKD